MFRVSGRKENGESDPSVTVLTWRAFSPGRGEVTGRGNAGRMSALEIEINHQGVDGATEHVDAGRLQRSLHLH